MDIDGEGQKSEGANNAEKSEEKEEGKMDTHDEKVTRHLGKYNSSWCG